MILIERFIIPFKSSVYIQSRMKVDVRTLGNAIAPTLHVSAYNPSFVRRQ